MFNTVLLIVMFSFIGLLLGLGFFYNKRIHNEEDFIVAGRSFNFTLTTFSLFATWFGAGALITSTDEIRVQGLRAISLEPFGAGMSLIFSGLFFAHKIWGMKIYTIADFYRVKFGKKAEWLSVVTTIPIFCGWVAVQFVALASLLHTFFGWNIEVTIVAIATISMVLTIMGGLWSVTITDSLQMVLIIGGLIVMFISVINTYGGFESLWSNTAPELKIIIPNEKRIDVFNWLSVFVVSALGNIPGQDVVQRMLSAKSAKVARWGCIVAGVVYIFIGAIPALLGIFSWQIIGPELEGSVIAAVAKSHLTPVMTIIFIVCIFATIFSTITSAILAPASVFAHNFLKNKFHKINTVTLCRIAVVFIAAISTFTALMGENFYHVLEESYAIGLVSFFVPMVIGLYDPKRLSEIACLGAMLMGLMVWSFGMLHAQEIPYDLIAIFFSTLTYYGIYYMDKVQTRD